MSSEGYEIIPMKPEDVLYSYRNSQQISSQTGLVGYIRADMGTTGNQFWVTWNCFRNDLNTPEFRNELSELLHSLRQDGKYLSDRGTLTRFCLDSKNALPYETGRDFGVRVNTGDHAYLMRLNPHKGEYNLYCYCYRKDWLDSHIRQAIQPERRLEHDRDSLHQTGRLQSAQPDLTRAAEGRAGNVRSDEAQIPERATQDPVLQPPDEMQADREPVRDRTDGAEDGERSYPSDGAGSGRDGAVEGAGSDDMGTPDEQHPTGSERDRDEQGDLHRIIPDGQTQHDDEPALSLSTTFGLADRIYDYLTDYIINFYEEADGEPLEVVEDGSDPVVVARIEHDLHDTRIMEDMIDYFDGQYERFDNDEEERSL